MKNFMYFADLAKMYFPESSKENARRNLNRAIKRCKSLPEKLQETGYCPYSHRVLTLRQLRLIFEHLGDPFEADPYEPLE